jgi:hypothetical protein
VSGIKVSDLRAGDRVSVTMIDPQRASVMDLVAYSLTPEADRVDPRQVEETLTVAYVSIVTPERAEEIGSWNVGRIEVTWREKPDSTVFRADVEFPRKRWWRR